MSSELAQARNELVHDGLVSVTNKGTWELGKWLHKCKALVNSQLPYYYLECDVPHTCGLGGPADTCESSEQ